MTKPKPKWNYLPLPDIIPFHFAEADNTYLRQILAGGGLGNIAEALIPELEEQLSQFTAYAKIEKEYPKRSEILAALSEIETHASALATRLRALDSASRQTIAPLLPELPFGDNGYYESDGDYIQALTGRLESLHSAITLVKSKEFKFALPSAKGGGIRSAARRTLAENIAKLFFNHTGTLPPASRDSVYESALICCINAATGSDLTDIHDLACEALTAAEVEIDSLK